MADDFYYLTCPLAFWGENFFNIVILYIAIVIGNFIGCILYRFIMIGEA